MLSYSLSSLCGSIFHGTNNKFSPNSKILYSPVSNRINKYDLDDNSCTTLDFENRSNTNLIDISNNSEMIISVDVDGIGILYSLTRNCIISRINFRGKVTAIQFSPDSTFLVLAIQHKIKIYEVPSTHAILNPLFLYKKYNNMHSLEILSIKWSSDSRFLITSSKDKSCKILSLHKIPEFTPFTLNLHKAPLILAFFFRDDEAIATISRDGLIGIWTWSQEYVKESKEKREYYQKIKNKKRKLDGNNFKEKNMENESSEDDEDYKTHATALERKVRKSRIILEKKYKFELSGNKIRSAAFNDNNYQIIFGMTNGSFGIYNMNTMENIHSFQISENRITSIEINSTGNWIAFSAKAEGQLFVWEWKSETYIMKQQSHFFEVKVIAFSPNSSAIATGGDDGKIKLWDSETCFCYATFMDHTATITGLCFIGLSGNALVSSSLDGCVRAYDLIRYKNFRKMTAPHPNQYTSVCADNTGDLIIAGGIDPPEICIWSLKTGKIVDILSGHTAPISSIIYGNVNNLIVSGSWDSTVRIWNLYADEKVESLEHPSEVISVYLSSDNKKIYSSTSRGQIFAWNLETRAIISTFESTKDLCGGRLTKDRMNADKSTKNKQMSSICCDPSSELIFGCGNSKFICIYDECYKILLRRISLTNNRSFDGILYKLNSKNMNEFGQLEIDVDSSDSDTNYIKSSKIPGAKLPEKYTRKTKLQFKANFIRCSPDSRILAIATTQGLMILKSQKKSIFEEFTFTETPEQLLEHLKKGQLKEAIEVSIGLEIPAIIESLITKIHDTKLIDSLCSQLRNKYIEKFLKLLLSSLEKKVNIENYINWVSSMIRTRGKEIKEIKSCIPILRGLHKYLLTDFNQLNQIVEENLSKLKYFSLFHEVNKDLLTTEPSVNL